MIIGKSPIGLGANPHVLVASLAANVLGLMLPIVMLQVYDRIIPKSGFETLTVLCMALVGAAIGDFCVRLARGRLLSNSGVNFESAAYDIAFRNLLQFGALNNPLDQGTLHDRLENIERVRKHHGSEAATALLDVPFIVIFVSVMTLISPVLGLSIIVITLVSIWIVYRQRTRILNLNLERQERDSRRHSFLAESIEGVEMIKSLGIETLMLRRYEWFMSANAAITRDMTQRINYTQGITSSISLAAPVMMSGIGSYLVINGDMSIGGLAAAVLLTGRVIQPTLRMEALFAGERDMKRSKRELGELLNTDLVHSGNQPLQKVDDIELKGISVHEGGPAQDADPDLSIKLSRGDCVLLTGTSGVRTSALLSVLAGHTKPQSGEIHINGVSIDDLSAEDLLDRISLLKPDYTMLEGSLLDNLTCFEIKKYYDIALDLSVELGIHEFISGHNDGLSTQVAAHTSNSLPKSVHDGALLISGLVKSPDVILFDEANAGLDLKIDKRMVEMLRRRRPDTIIVMVSHRPSYQALANRHLSVDGKFVREVTAQSTATQAPA